LLLLASLTCALPRDVRAAEPRVSLKVERQPGALGCPSEEVLRTELEALAAAPSFESSDLPQVVVLVQIRPLGGGFAAEIELSGARSGERTLEDEGPGCEVLTQALVVTIAILLDSEPESPAIPKPSVTQPAVPKPADRDYFSLPAVPLVPPARPKPASFPLLTASLAAVYDFGTLDDDAGGLTLAAEFFVSYLTVGAGLVWLPDDRVELSNQTIHYGLIAGRARMCSRPPFAEPFGFSLCSGFLAGQRRGSLSPLGDEETSTSLGAYVAFESNLELSRRVTGPFGLFASLGFGAPVLREPIEVPVPGLGRALPLAAQPATFQTAAGVRFWLDR